MTAPPGETIPLGLLIGDDAEGREDFFDQSAVLYAGSTIRRMREHAGISQKEMAARIGTPWTTAASRTCGWAMIVFSSSTELIHSPPDFTRSLVRSTSWM